MSTGSAMSGSSSSAPAADTSSSNPPAQGANTFGSLKGLFKVNTAKCKHCGKTFTPKTTGPKI